MLSDHFRGSTERLMVTVITSDPSNSRLEVVGRDAAVIQVSVPTNHFIRWPKTGEYWTIVRENGIWRLDSLIQASESFQKSTTLEPGQAFLSADTVWTPAKFRISVNGYFDAEEDLDVNLTTPQSSQFMTSRLDDLDRLTDINPGVYNWGIFAYEVNSGTAPVTAIGARARGQSVFTISSSGRAYGVDATIHGLEITAGLHPSVATAQITGETPILTDIKIVEKASRFEPGMSISGVGIPASTTILSVIGRPGYPERIIMSNNADPGASGSITITAEIGGTPEGMGILITGNNGTSLDPNLLGPAIQIQSQNAQSRWQYGVNIGASGLQAEGTAFRLASATAKRGLSIESSILEDGIVISSGSVSNAAIRIVLDAPIKIGQAIGAGKGYLEMWNQSASPNAPNVDAARMFFKDNGSGKKQFCIRTTTGTHIVWTEP